MTLQHSKVALPQPYISQLALKTPSREGSIIKVIKAAVAALHQTVRHVSSSRFLLGFSLEHSVAHGVTSLCEYQRPCTEIAVRHRDVNYKGVTVTLKDVGSMFIVLAQRKCLIHRLTR